MDLYGGSLYWPDTVAREPFQRKELKESYDIAIIGGGMSGSLCAYVLSKENLSVALFDHAEAGAGSTSANTGLLQFSNDIMLHELIDQIGEEEAVEFYKACEQALFDLHAAAESLPVDASFHYRDSLYYASEEEDVPRIKKEYETLKKYGFRVEYFSREQIEEHFPFSKPAAIVTHGDAVVNPLAFCLGALKHAQENGADIFENVHVEEPEDKGNYAEMTVNGKTVRAKYIVFTTGYEPTPDAEIKQKKLLKTYVLVTNPVDDLSAWHKRMMIWETKRPYLYMRLSDENRIIVGGLDEEADLKKDHAEDVKEKGQKLLKEVQAMFPSFELTADYSYGAIFGESKDELPVVGEHPEHPRLLYLIGLGGNGTVYSMVGANLIKDLVAGEPNEEKEILQLDR